VNFFFQPHGVKNTTWCENIILGVKKVWFLEILFSHHVVWTKSLFFSDGARKKYSSPRPRFPWGSRPVGPAAGLPGLSAKLDRLPRCSRKSLHRSPEEHGTVWRNTRWWTGCSLNLDGLTWHVLVTVLGESEWGVGCLRSIFALGIAELRHPPSLEEAIAKIDDLMNARPWVLTLISWR